jgi:hypothetical protein
LEMIRPGSLSCSLSSNVVAGRYLDPSFYFPPDSSAE